jgi:hypothetical protein
MSGKLGTPSDIFMIQVMFDQPLNHNDNGFIHFVAEYGPDQLSSHSTFFHG